MRSKSAIIPVVVVAFFFLTTNFQENLNTYIINLYIYLTTPNRIFVAHFLEPLEIGMGGAGKAWE